MASALNRNGPRLPVGHGRSGAKHATCSASARMQTSGLGGRKRRGRSKGRPARRDSADRPDARVPKLVQRAHLSSRGGDGGDADAMRRLKRRLVYRRSPARMRRGRYGCARATGRGAVRCVVVSRSLVAFAVRAILRTGHIFFWVSPTASLAVFGRAQCGRAARGVRRRAPRHRKPGSGPCALVHGLVLAQPVHREACTPRANAAAHA